MNLTDILFTRESEIFGFNDGTVDVFTLDLSHLLFILDSEILTDELRIDCYDFNQFVP
jgi:hypothetical protein